MKTKTLFSRLVYLAIISIVINTSYSCAAFFDADIESPLLKDNVRIQDYYEPNSYSKNIFGASAGVGFNSFDGESTTSICPGIEYLFRVSEDREEGAAYLGATATYHYESADEFKLNSFRVGPKFTYFDRLTRDGVVDLTYGLKAHYEFGNIENFGNKEDVTGYGLTASIGANFNVNERLSIGVEAPFASWGEQTFEFSGGDITRDNTWIGLNKDNVAMGYVRWRF
ncbi:hypothetical protein [Psychroserpens sp.]|uniref:hypothetical protein n=1 Tax=Psychroserpens sp. TaxID=2020870 RepID=UPI001B01C149|nr:hypothetical protein [Psychroserpens sp.]MBO6605332.1 hypothetical protein [Psychroserpens sp.]MBO6629985.1 hypothetical protein [Psychroserpens sp.]MBO6653859.1 hypothetical protein [Psychroserpens sp.]MBO6682180.1 hypothetical protein [Psychroserpens sp.]MBO6748706.1 hypothetical protein [Psychroserpens sp.]